MSQIDYYLRFATRAAAKADVEVAKLTVLDDQSVRQWLASNAVEVTVWRASQDVVTGTGTPADPFITTHTPLTGFYILISLPQVVPALRDHAAVQVVWDVDKMNAGEPGFVLKSGVSNAILQDLRTQTFAGRNVPWGALN